MFIHQKLLEDTDIVFLCVYAKHIFFSFYQSVGFEENIKYTKNDIASAMEFDYVTNKIVFTLQVYFARSDGH